MVANEIVCIGLSEDTLEEKICVADLVIHLLGNHWPAASPMAYARTIASRGIL